MILEKIRSKAASDIQHIILPEGEDERTIKAAEICVRQKLAKITLIGNEAKIRETAAGAVPILPASRSLTIGRHMIGQRSRSFTMNFVVPRA